MWNIGGSSSTDVFIHQSTAGLCLSMELPRARMFILLLMAGFLLPEAIPSVGLDTPYFFLLSIVLIAWLIMKWDSVKAITARSQPFEVVLALGAIGVLYAFKAYEAAKFGLIDLMLVFLAVIVLTYGLKSLKLFWVPVAYGLVLLAGYQIETYTPNYVALQDWLAGVMVGAVGLFGITATATGHIVTLFVPGQAPIHLDITGECSGLQGILAFGLLSTMTLLDFRPRLSRLVPIFAIGFLGAFLINILRLLVEFLTFEYGGVSAGNLMHFYFGYVVFIAWVLVFWVVAFRYLAPPRGAISPQASLVAKMTR